VALEDAVLEGEGGDALRDVDELEVRLHGLRTELYIHLFSRGRRLTSQIPHHLDDRLRRLSKDELQRELDGDDGASASNSRRAMDDCGSILTRLLLLVPPLTVCRERRRRRKGAITERGMDLSGQHFQ